MKEFEINSCVRGYHVYSSIWEISIGEQFECARETLNDSDRYAVAVIKDCYNWTLRLCSLFLRRGGSIMCTVTTTRHYLADLSQGSLEVFCLLPFKAQPKEIRKLKVILHDD